MVQKIIEPTTTRETEKAELEVTLIQDNITKPISVIQPLEDISEAEHERP